MTDAVFDPRTKLVLLFLTVIAASTAPNLEYEFVLVLLIAAVGIASGKWRYALKGAMVFSIMYLITRFYIREHVGTIYTMLIAWLSLIYQIYPCGMLAGIAVSTTEISEFLSGMSKMHIPTKITIPLVIMFRYFPVVREDWHYIKDAMRLRDVEPSLKGFIKNPGLTLECIYVPLLMAASNAADELSIASVTRGIENPAQITSLRTVRFKVGDVAILVVFIVFVIGGFLW